MKHYLLILLIFLTLNASAANVHVISGNVNTHQDEKGSTIDQSISKLHISKCEFTVSSRAEQGNHQMYITFNEREFSLKGVKINQLANGECELHFDTGAKSIRH